MVPSVVNKAVPDQIHPLEAVAAMLFSMALNLYSKGCKGLRLILTINCEYLGQIQVYVVRPKSLEFCLNYCTRKYL